MLLIWEPNLVYLTCYWTFKITYLGSDVSSHKGVLVRRGNYWTKGIVCSKKLTEKGLPAWNCEPGD